MAVKNIQDLLTQDTVELKDKYLQVRVNRDGYTRTHEGIYSYVCKEKDGELYLFPIELDGKGTLYTMEASPIAYTDEDNIHFVVNTVTDPYTQAFIRTEDITGLNKGKQLLQAFLAFVEDRFRFGVYNIFVANNREQVFTLKDAEADDADKVESKNEEAYESRIVSFPIGNKREDVRHSDQSEGMGDTSEPAEEGRGVTEPEATEDSSTGDNTDTATE